MYLRKGSGVEWLALQDSKRLTDKANVEPGRDIKCESNSESICSS